MLDGLVERTGIMAPAQMVSGKQRGDLHCAWPEPTATSA
jgi:hypothetical protein